MLHSSDLQERARIMTFDALGCLPPIPDNYRADLVLSMHAEGHNRVYELYVARGRPEDAIVLACATLDARTGEGSVKVFPERWTTR